MPLLLGSKRAALPVTGPWLNNGSWSARNLPFSNSPQLGPELLTNTTFDVDTTGWTSVNASLSSVAGGKSGNNMLVQNTAASIGYAHQAGATANGDWVLCVFYHKNGTAATAPALGSTSSGVDVAPAISYSGGSFVQRALSGRALGANTYARLTVNSGSVGVNTNFDEVSLRKITLNTLFNVRLGAASPASVAATGTIATGGISGVVYGLDSITNPQNLIQATHNGSSAIKLEKMVAGSWTTVLSTTATYAAGSLPEIRWTGGTTFQLWYGGSQRGADQTIADAGTGLYHGVMSTHPDNVFLTVTVA